MKTFLKSGIVNDKTDEYICKDDPNSDFYAAYEFFVILGATDAKSGFEPAFQLVKKYMTNPVLGDAEGSTLP